MNLTISTLTLETQLRGDIKEAHTCTVNGETCVINPHKRPSTRCIFTFPEQGLCLKTYPDDPNAPFYRQHGEYVFWQSLPEPDRGIFLPILAAGSTVTEHGAWGWVLTPLLTRFRTPRTFTKSRPQDDTATWISLTERVRALARPTDHGNIPDWFPEQVLLVRQPDGSEKPVIVDYEFFEAL